MFVSVYNWLVKSLHPPRLKTFFCLVEFVELFFQNIKVHRSRNRLGGVNQKFYLFFNI